MKLFNLWNSLIICLVLILSKVTADESVVTAIFKNDEKYQGTDDTFVRKGSAFSGGMSNFGRCPTIEINEQTRLGLIRFDVSARSGGKKTKKPKRSSSELAWHKHANLLVYCL